MPSEIVALSRKYLRRSTHIRAEDDPLDTGSGQVTQHVFRTHPLDKLEMLARLLQARNRGLTMVFCQTKRECHHVSTELCRRGFAAAAVHGDLGQGQRERALRAFRNGKVDVLVATDVAARGIDVDDVTHVVNYECPGDEKTYTHRIGRTGRAGRSGTAVTFIDWQELLRWKLINRALGLPFADPPETYSTSPHFFDALDIPRDAKGVLAKEEQDRAGLAAEEVEDIGETGRASRTKDRERSRQRRSRPRKRTRRGVPTTRSAAEPTGETAAKSDADSSARTRRRTRRRSRRNAGTNSDRA